MKANIPLLITLITLSPSIRSAPDPVVVADFDKALIVEGSTPEHANLGNVLERILKLEKEVYFLDQQVVSISKELFDKYGLYIVRPGDTLGQISKNHGTSLKELLELNAGLDPRKLEVGQIIRIKD